MKLAVVHDYLCGFGGSERVFEYICQEFPEADVFASACNPKNTYPYFSSRPVRTTWINPFVRNGESFRWFFPLATHAMESLDLSAYDLVLTSSATVAKYVRVPKEKHVCYCYIPTRALWNFDNYFRQKGLKSKLVKPFLSHLRRRDLEAAQRVGQFVAISEDCRQHISNVYRRDADIIPCPIDTEKFYAAPRRKEHYLIVSRLEHWKRVDYAIEAFNRLNLPLRIVGTGVEESRLKAMAGPNVTFLGTLDDVALSKEYSEAKAVIFTPFLEYGLIPLEANASGCPVICLGKGGTTETMVPLGKSAKATAVFFDEQTPEALIQAVKQFQGAVFQAQDLIDHARLWSIPAFQGKMRAYLESYYRQITRVAS